MSPGLRISLTRDRVLDGSAIAAIIVAVVCVYLPGVYGFWGRDDFMQLAFSRLVGSPWPAFVHDHFPVPGSVFRPLGFASMWLCAMVFGADYEANAIADLALHAGVSVVLLVILFRAGIPRWIACLCTLVFALHPATIGTALWWSARFDLLSTLFVALSLRWAFDYRDRQRPAALACALLAALAAMLSKEIGLTAVVALSLLWLRWAWTDPLQRVRAGRALVLIWLVAALYLGWRASVLGTAASGLAGAGPLHRLLFKGVMDWLVQAPGYWSFWPRLGVTRQIMLVVALGMLAAGFIASFVSSTARRMAIFNVDLAMAGLVLFLLPALLQAPIAAQNGAPISAGVSAIETAMQSRLYYLGIAGAALVLAAVLAVAVRNAGTGARVAVLVGLGLLVITEASISHRSARAFAKRSVAISAVARDAVAAVEALDLPATHCHVIFLDVDPAPEWSVYVSMDSVVKALSPDLQRVRRCYFHSNYISYFHLQGNPVDRADIAPYGPMQVGGVDIPWRRIGDLTIAYLQAPAESDVEPLAGMTFLRYRGNVFEDVTADVLADCIAVRLQ